MFYYKEKNGKSLLILKKELTVYNYPEYTEEVIERYTTITEEEFNLLTQEELNSTSIEKSQLKKEINKKKCKLQQTDYVVIKIYEAKICEEDTTSMIQEYADVIARRKVLRQEINQLQEELKMLE